MNLVAPSLNIGRLGEHRRALEELHTYGTGAELRVSTGAQIQTS
jgi:hypothetical protein